MNQLKSYLVDATFLFESFFLAGERLRRELAQEGEKIATVTRVAGSAQLALAAGGGARSYRRITGFWKRWNWK